MVEEKTVGIPMELADEISEVMMALQGFNSLLAQAGDDGAPAPPAWGNIWALHFYLVRRLEALTDQAAKIGRDEE